MDEKRDQIHYELQKNNIYIFFYKKVVNPFLINTTFAWKKLQYYLSQLSQILWTKLQTLATTTLMNKKLQTFTKNKNQTKR